MQKSDSIKNIASALLTFHVKVGKISKDANNPFFRSRYASLSNILEEIQVPLTESGLVIAQFPDSDNKLTTILIHTESGEWMESSYDMEPVPEYLKEKDRDNNIIWRGDKYTTPQAVGSAITYARRYALGAILQLNIDEDDDGNTGSGNKPAETKPKSLPWLNENSTEFKGAVEKMRAGKSSIQALKNFFRISKEVEQKLIESSK